MALPNFLKITDQGLEYLDILVYTALRWFNNVKDSNCKPMHETIGKLAGLSKRFVIESIKRLEMADVITVERSEAKRVSNQYYFAEPHRNEAKDKIPKDFFDLTCTLTKNERAMLLCLRQFFHDGSYECHESQPVKFFAKWLGLSENTVRKQFAGLIAKGYIAERSLVRKNSDKAYRYYRLTDKLNWNYEEYENVAKPIYSQPLKVA